MNNEKLNIISLDISDALRVYKLIKDTYSPFEFVSREFIEEIFKTSISLLGVVDSDQLIGFTAIRKMTDGLLESRFFTVRPGRSDAAVLLARELYRRYGDRVRVSALGLSDAIKGLTNTGFKPIRRILKIVWDLRTIAPQDAPHYIVPATQTNINTAAKCYLEGLSTHWDWWIREEAGGWTKALEKAKKWMATQKWFVALMGGEPVGAAGYARHPRLDYTAWFSGVAVKPSYRLQGLGRKLMEVILSEASRDKYKELIVYTYSPLIGLAPGAILYLKTGGVIKAEYIHFRHL